MMQTQICQQSAELLFLNFNQYKNANDANFGCFEKTLIHLAYCPYNKYK